ncbi:MAG: hypothetical protein ACRDD8_15875 [Bacteroidales bacterium]
MKISVRSAALIKETMENAIPIIEHKSRYSYGHYKLLSNINECIDALSYDIEVFHKVLKNEHIEVSLLTFVVLNVYSIRLKIISRFNKKYFDKL